MQGSQVTDINDKFLYSLSQLSNAFGPARETISKRLQAGGVRPAGSRAGHDVFHIRDAAQAIVLGDNNARSFETIENPDALPPKERLDWYKSENERTKLQKESGLLVPIDEHQLALSAVVKLVVMTLDTMGDNLERSGVGDAEVLRRIDAAVDAARERLAVQLEELANVC